MNDTHCGTLPVFPQNRLIYPTRNFGVDEQFPGLTKRELFAAMAMQGMLATDEAWDRSEEKIATYAVDQADALLAELSKGPTE